MRLDSLIYGWLIGLVLAGTAGLAEDALLKSFVTPPESAKPHTWWHWMDGQATREGITLDLEDMKRVGLGGLHLFDGGLDTPVTDIKPVTYRSPEWFALVQHTAAECKRLGLEFGMHGAAGWSLAGGTWVKSEQAMRKLVWSEATARGPSHLHLSLSLPRPPGIASAFQDNPADLPKGKDADWRPNDYRDSSVVAFRMPAGTQCMADAKPVLSSNIEKLDCSLLSDGRYNASLTLNPAADKKTDRWIQFSFAEPFMARSLMALGGKGDAVLLCGESAETLKPVTKIKLPDALSARSTPATAVFEAARGKVFRLVFSRLAAPVRLAEVTLHGEALVNGWDGKAGFCLVTDFSKTPAIDVPETAALQSHDVVDVTACLKGDTLTWEVPEGNWVILRLGHSPTGKCNGPAPEGAGGLECDKLDREAVRAYYTAFLEPLKQKLGPLFGKPGFNAMLADSWEAGVQNWTPRFIEAFKQKRGYSPIPYLPVMTGRVVGSAELSERFLWDVRRTIGDLVAECFYGEAQKICEENGLLFYSEAPGVGLALADAMQCKSRVAVPMGEFWVCSASQGPEYYMRHPLNNDDCKEAASAAHLAGRAVVAAESFTAGTHSPWQQYPATMKAEGDFYFAQGINRFFFHTYAHQPWSNRKPGMTMSRFGTHLGRTVTWWKDGAPAYMTYLARCQFLLQRGRSVSDFALFLSEEVPGGLRLSKDPALQPPDGFDFDACGAETLLGGFTVADGALTLPHGARYRALVLAKSTRLTLPLAKKVASLVRDGATVIGPPLAGTPGLSDYPTSDAEVRAISKELWGESTSGIDRKIGKGRVLWNGSLSNACARLPLQPDVEIQSSTNTVFRWIHRVDNDSDIYFVANQQDRDVTATVTFRVSGKRPELWNPVTGEAGERPAYRATADGRTAVTLSFAAFESSFVVFRVPLTAEERPNEKQAAEIKTLMTVGTPWTVTFDPAHGGPATPQPFAALADWTQSSLDSIKYYSGTAVYTTAFDCPQPDQATFLDLGKVQNIAALKLNGHELGTVWTAPWRVKVSGLLKEKDNVLEIRVTNLWPNRIIGDQALPEEKRIAKLVFAPLLQSFYKKDTPLLSSGLLGPVNLVKGVKE
jgi:hypothetical protein